MFTALKGMATEMYQYKLSTKIDLFLDRRDDGENPVNKLSLGLLFLPASNTKLLFLCYSQSSKKKHTPEHKIKIWKLELHPTIRSDEDVPRKELGHSQHQTIKPANIILRNMIQNGNSWIFLVN